MLPFSPKNEAEDNLRTRVFDVDVEVTDTECASASVAWDDFGEFKGDVEAETAVEAAADAEDRDRSFEIARIDWIRRTYQGK